MRWSLPAALVLAVVLPAAASAQQGSLRLSTATQALTGDAQRLSGQERYEPDFGLTWMQPGSRFGMLNVEIRGTRRDGQLHLGRAYGAIRDFRKGGILWTVEGGDAYFSPTIADYKFSNLFAPPVTFSGATVEARTGNTSIALVAGKATAWRNIFGSDPETLGQTLLIGRVSRQVTERLDVNVRASRVRTTDLKEFVARIAASDQGGGGVRFSVTPSIQLIGDASLVWYERMGTASRVRDASGLVGMNWLHSKGWVQVNASRFSPGELPTINTSLQDRTGVFAAAEYDVLARLRVFGGYDVFRTNLDPDAPAGSVPAPPRSTGSRIFSGVRMQIGSRSTFTVRAEDGDRVARPVAAGLESESDTGSIGAEWQTAIGTFTAFARYAWRENVDRLRTVGTYSQHESSAQVFANLTRTTQIFGLATVTVTRDAAGGGSTYWQAGGGSQLQLGSLWLRSEGMFSRNLDLLTQNYVPRESLNTSINGRIAPNTTLGVNVYLDHSPNVGASRNPWGTRSMIRLTHTFTTGTPAVRRTIGSAAAARLGTATVVGTAYADWNANGVLDQGEEPVEGIKIEAEGTGYTITAGDGDFAFEVPVGLRSVALDVGTLPVDYDPPAIPRVQLELSKGDSVRVSFGVVPLGAIRGRVVRDVNGNRTADPQDEPVNDAVVVLDGGSRSERSRDGVFTFEAVRVGDHTLELLIASLPSGSQVDGEVERIVSLGREQNQAEIVFLVSHEKRPEIRKVFPGRQGTGKVEDKKPSTPARPASRSGASKKPRRSEGAQTRSRETRTGRFVIQVAAVRDPDRADALVAELKRAGFAAYRIGSAGRQIRVRVGAFPTRSAAEHAASMLEQQRGDPVWILEQPAAEGIQQPENDPAAPREY